jgi:hypothetical protein
MSVVEFGDHTFLEFKTYWFVWEPSWDKWRPIQGFEWNGTSFVIDDGAYCNDPLDPYYGFGSPQMMKLCELLEFKRKEGQPKEVDSPVIGERTWVRDRYVAVTACAPTDLASWKRLVKGKPRTCRRPPPGKKLTKRNRAYKK